MFFPHTVCRACGYATPGVMLGKSGGGSCLDAEGNYVPDKPAPRLIPVLDLGIQPLANDFAWAGQERHGYAPLEVLLCPRCNLAQLSATVRPDILYSRYAYVTNRTPTMMDHFAALWSELVKERPIASVVEIGSNDGTFLKFCLDQKVDRVLGIEPAVNLVKIAREQGINTLDQLFDSNTARMASVSFHSPALIIARHVFCHIDDWQQFMHNVAVMCDQETLVAIEVPYVMDMMEKGSFDQVYHEHLSYLNVKAIQYLLDGSAMRLHKVLRFPIHGGVIVLLLRRRDSVTAVDQSINDITGTEKCGLEEWSKFEVRARDQISSLKTFVGDLAKSGKRVCGHGASAKATVWINACGFTRKEMNYVMDSTNGKVYSTVPGTDIPVVDEGTNLYDSAHYTVVFAWNYLDHILKMNKQYIEKGGKLIVPIPEIKVLP